MGAATHSTLACDEIRSMLYSTANMIPKAFDVEKAIATTHEQSLEQEWKTVG